MAKKSIPRHTHSCTLILERMGLRSETGVFTTLILAQMLEKAKQAEMSVVGTRHSKHCLCGDGSGEIVYF